LTNINPILGRVLGGIVLVISELTTKTFHTNLQKISNVNL